MYTIIVDLTSCIANIKHHIINNVSPISESFQFIRIYSSYREYLSFIPNVLTNIIIEYCNDNIEIECKVLTERIIYGNFHYIKVVNDNLNIEFKCSIADNQIKYILSRNFASIMQIHMDYIIHIIDCKMLNTCLSMTYDELRLYCNKLTNNYHFGYVVYSILIEAHKPHAHDELMILYHMFKTYND